MKPVAHILSGFGGKFGAPRQSGLAPSSGALVVFEPEFRNPDALRGLDGFDYVWLVWEFSENGPRWEPTVRPPRLGGNRRMGVFATRSTFRPNPIGLSSVRLRRVYVDPELGPVIEVGGADLIDGTPILDIKPYIPYADSHPDARAGWTDGLAGERLEVKWETDVPAGLKPELEEILSLDPRPAYIGDGSREYGMDYRGRNVRFRVEDGTLTVISV